MTIFFLNKGQSRVKVSYSPPSPQTFEPYLSFWWIRCKKKYDVQRMLHGYKIVFQYKMVSLTNEQYAWHLILSRVSILPQVVVLHSWNWDIITSSTPKLDYQLLLRKKSLHSSPKLRGHQTQESDGNRAYSSPIHDQCLTSPCNSNVIL